MRKIMIAPLLFSLYLGAMAQDDNIKDIFFPCVVSRLSLQMNIFSRDDFTANNSKPWYSLAIEPFHLMTIFYDHEIQRTSPVKKILKQRTKFLIYTISGSVYRVPQKYMRMVKNLEEDHALYTNINIFSNKIYTRNNIKDIKNELKNGTILPGTSFHEWRLYDAEQDKSIYAMSSKISALRNSQSLDFEVLSREDMSYLSTHR